MESLNTMFMQHYAKFFEQLNKHIYPAARNGNFFEAPSIVSSGDGVTIFSTLEAEKTYTKQSPMRIGVMRTQTEAVFVYQDIVIPYDELEIGLRDPAYFVFLMNRVLAEALRHYRAKVGNETETRFGSHYCLPYKENEIGNVFKEDGNGNVIMTLNGAWARG